MGDALVVSSLSGLASILGALIPDLCSYVNVKPIRPLAVGTGFLLGSVLFAMMPAVFRPTAAGHAGPVLMAVGFFGLLLVQRLGATFRQNVKSLVVWAPVCGYALHSFLEGTLLGLAIRGGQLSGMTAGLSLFLHKLPEGVGLATLIQGTKCSPRLALFACGLVGISLVVGTWVTMAWTTFVPFPSPALAGVAAGGLLYIGTADSTWLLMAGAILAHMATYLV